jgi:nucleoside-diphosphate-sugar epimerase
MSRAFVTGAAGFIGANVVRRLLADGDEVHVALRPGQHRWRLSGIEREITVHELDLADRDAVHSCLGKLSPERIIHLAAHGGYSSQTDVGRILDSNVLGTANLLTAAIRCGTDTFVNAGSSSEYGEKDHAPLEDEALDPDSYYAIGKAAATHLCRYVARHYDISVTTLRLYSAYGPWEEPTRLMPTLVVRGLRGTLPPLTLATTVRDYIYIDDVVEAFCLAAHNRPMGGAVFNIGSGQQTSLAEVVDLARLLLGIDEEPSFGTMPARPWETTVWVANIARTEAGLGWRATVSLRDGIERLTEWLRDNAELLAHYERAQSSVRA